MTKLILNVDRDDDFGRKAGITSPIIGIKANLEAAQSLGLADAEDSDLNAIYLACSLYNRLINQKEEIEIATICGHINVGITSDQLLTKQLEKVIETTKATEVILISDGAEDEYILPIIQSRIKINSIQRVSVKQSRHLEDAYYRIIKMMDDPKVKKQFFLPLAIIFIVWSLFAIFDMASSGLGAIIFTLGLYLIIRALNWEERISYQLNTMKLGILNSKLSFYTGMIAFLIVAISIFYGYSNTNFTSAPNLAIPILSMLSQITWGLVTAGIIATSGFLVDTYLREDNSFWHMWIFPFSLLAFGFIASAGFEALYLSVINDYSIDPFLTPHFIGYSLVGVLVAAIGSTTNHYIKQLHEQKEQERELEKQTQQVTN